MDSEQFEKAFKPLMDTFKNFYSDARRIEVFETVRSMDVAHFNHFVKKALWSAKPPTLDDFQAEVNRVRKVKEDEAARHKRIMANSGLGNIFTETERKEHFQFLKDVLSGKRSKADVAEYTTYLQTAINSAIANQKTSTCTLCRDDGLVLMRAPDGEIWAYACTCPKAKREIVTKDKTIIVGRYHSGLFKAGYKFMGDANTTNSTGDYHERY